MHGAACEEGTRQRPRAGNCSSSDTASAGTEDKAQGSQLRGAGLWVVHHQLAQQVDGLHRLHPFGGLQGRHHRRHRGCRIGHGLHPTGRTQAHRSGSRKGRRGQATCQPSHTRPASGCHETAATQSAAPAAAGRPGGRTCRSWLATYSTSTTTGSGPSGSLSHGTALSGSRLSSFSGRCRMGRWVTVGLEWDGGDSCQTQQRRPTHGCIQGKPGWEAGSRARRFTAKHSTYRLRRGGLRLLLRRCGVLSRHADGGCWVGRGCLLPNRRRLQATCRCLLPLRLPLLN